MFSIGSPAPRDPQARRQWRVQCHMRWQEIKASPHYHNGAPCHAEPTCKYYDPAPQLFEDDYQ